MNRLIPTIIFVFLLFFLSCSDTLKENELSKNREVVELSKSQKILMDAFEAHGGELYNSAHFSFIFRGNSYEFKNNQEAYEYTKIVKKTDSTVVDVLINGDFKRFINDEEAKLNEKETQSGSEAINSVLYFVTLPSKLLDKSVNTKFIENTLIKGKNYEVLEITFDQAGGGEDHEDEYYYWVNQETKKIEYLAYNYLVNGGGVRFRSAFDTRVVAGITFQDYVNYKAEVETPLRELPALWEEGKLIELSEIKTEDVVNLK